MAKKSQRSGAEHVGAVAQGGGERCERRCSQTDLVGNEEKKEEEPRSVAVL